ncbi:hypothetical protein FG167_14210 [Lacinutrix sp. WUR7]|uniref:Tc toxin subunit A-related protein n=1 Tax=Lacinutrix sp. WUR7 TaxID=2653681 RepID=UPI00193E6568|nr:neuraminidase-like domain-containing protein [Lacinutrix sp. WUR7]QRM90340.1 hypothetical protein FG167_14210 [Lacinutrix sp. WUR7]
MTTIIQGILKHPSCTDLTKYVKLLYLELYACTLTKEQKIKDIPFDKEGNFKVELEKGDIEVQYLVKLVYKAAKEKEVIRTSAKLCSCKTHELDFYFDPKRYEILLPYLQEQVKPHLEGLSIDKLTEEQLQQLACLSKQDITDLRALQQSELWNDELQEITKNKWLEWEGRVKEDTYFKLASSKLEDLTQEPKESLSFLFALTKGGVTDWKQGISASSNQLTQKIANANDNKWVHIDQRAQGVLLKGIGYLRDAILLNVEEDDLYYDAKLIAVSSLPFLEKSTLLNAVLDAGSLQVYLTEEDETEYDDNDSTKIVKRLKKQPVKTRFNKKGNDELEQIISWDKTLKEFPPLLAIVVPELRKNKWDKTSLLKYTQENWRELIHNVAGELKYPSSYKDSEEPIQSYAYDLTRTLTDQFPTEKLVGQLKQSELPNKNDFYRVLSRNPDFDIQNQAVSRHFTKGENDRAPEVVSERDYKNLQELQRTIKLADGIENLHLVETLLKEDLTSGMQIIRLGKFDFTNKMQAYDFQDWEIRGIWCRAEAYYDTSKEIMRQYLQYDRKNAFVPSILKGLSGAQPDISTTNTAIALNLPDMELLFGSLDTCSCEHCQSVYSPAAYLTDMLQWLKSDMKCQQTGNNGFVEINSRRPDIQYIQLNCKNTNTVLPYIDLVNEVLLTHLEGNIPIDPFLRGLQTTWETDRLLMEPEHINLLEFEDAMGELRSAKYPWSLPYDRNTDLAQNYLLELDISYATLVNDLSVVGNEYDSKHWANAKLGLLSFIDRGSVAYPEWSIITRSHMASTVLKSYYGIDPDYFVQDILDATSLDYTVFKTLLEQVYIIQNETITFTKDDQNPCDLSKMKIIGFEKVADRLMRFERLRSSTNLSVEELDAAIHYLGGGDLNSDFLKKLAGAVELRDVYSISIDAQMVLWDGSSDTDKKLLLSKLSGFDTFNIEALVTSMYTPLNTTLKKPLDVLQFLKICTSIKKLGIHPAELISMILGINSWSLIPTSVSREYGEPIHNSISNGWNAMCDDLKSPANAYYIVIELYNEVQLIQVDIDALGSTSDPIILDEIDDLNDKKTAVNTKINLHLADYADEIEATIKQSLGNTTQLGLAFVDRILSSSDFTNWIQKFLDPFTWIDWLDLNSTLQDDFAACYRTLLRIAVIKQATGVTNELLSDVIDKQPSLSTSNFAWFKKSFGTTTSFDIKKAIQKIAWVKDFSSQSTTIGISFIDYYKQVIEVKSNPITDQNASDLKAIEIRNEMNSDNWYATFTEQQYQSLFSNATALTNGKDLVEIHSIAITLSIYSSTNPENIKDIWGIVWKNAAFDAFVENGLGDNVTVLAAMVEANNTEAQWIKKNTTINNRVRVNLRSALVAYYIHYKAFKNENEIYAHFLLDPEMEACMKTSRTKLAISGMQMLIHRAMMGLEEHLCPTEDNKLEWEWRKNYRVWEANRKVFLYPENWIEPELRLDKSEFFQELEDALLQDEINDENAEKAMQRYLSKLNDVARLDIRGTYFESDGKGEFGSGIFHVFGRTFSTPHEYYYRKREVNRVWTAWEKLELDIEGEHIIPVVHNRKLHLYWPMFIEKEDRKIKRVIDGNEQNAPYYEVKMCYSKLEFGKWSPKKILEGTMLAGNYAGKGCFNNLRYKLGQDVGYKLIKEVQNPNWKWWKPNPDHPYGETGPLLKVYGPDETNNGSLVWSNSVYQDYAPVSMDKNKFFFWAEKSTNSGELTIHVRRDFDEAVDNYHDGYTELAYEDSFRISACDDRLEIIPPVIEEVLFGEPTNESRFLARPYNTLPNAQLMIEGKDVENDKYPSGGLYAKREITHANGSDRILDNTNGTYQLTHLHQYKHVYSHLPFFMGDNLHTLFFEKRVEKSCVKIPIYNDGGEKTWYTTEYKNVLSKYHVQPHEHPYACLMLAEMNQFGIKGLLASRNPNNQLRRQQQNATYFKNEYQPVPLHITEPYPKDEFDFSYFGAYQKYNWEIFFHAPSLIARQLKSNAQFADAIKWLQFVFDPTNRDVSDYKDKRFWMIKPFLQDVSEDSIQNLMHLLGATGLNPEQEQKRVELKAQIETWKNDPFNPHGIAEMRYRAYMLWTVCEYIDILIEWGDSLFRQDSIESLNEASNLYILAAELLGNRPKNIEKSTNSIAKSFADLGNIDAFSNAIMSIESEIPSYNPTICCKEQTNNERFQLPDLLFCIPDNPKLQELWNRTEGRLFKIRHCMNIEGQVRELPLFQPPIEPALLVRARAMGIDIGEVLNDIAKPEPHYRYNYLLQKANEFTGEVKALGGALLSALEKKDAEELNLIRQVYEENILKVTKNLKKMSIDEAKLGLASAQHSKKLIEIRLSEYEGKEYKSSREQNAIDQTRTSEAFMYLEQASQLIAAGIVHVPDTYAGYSPLIKLPGGDKFAFNFSAIASSFGIIGSVYRNKASMSSTYAGYDRRQEDWNFQIKTAKEELLQVEKSIISAEIRIAIAEKDLENHELQIEQSKEIFDFVKNKFTNLNLYSWMTGELMKLHYRAYKLAYEMAKQAQRAMNKELNIDLSLVDFGHWNSSKKGLLAGEQLSMQLKELDNTYIKNDKRRFELSKDISLKLLDPGALVNLIQHKYCKFKLEEDLLNLVFKSRDLTGMQIKSIGISIPCVTGPQVSTNVKLRVEGGEEFITSTGINDMGVFEPNFNQARYMPFEYLKLDSNKIFELMLDEDSEYEITTISDVVLHVRYYAENTPNTVDIIDNKNIISTEQHLLMSWKYDFPQEWQKKLGDISSTPPELTINNIPYKLRKLVTSSLPIASIEYYVMYEDKSFSELENNFGAITLNGNIFNHNSKAVADIWLLYTL